MTNDPYQVLGLSPSASQEEAKRAYRQLAKQYHPDLHPGDAAAAQRMNEINAAYAQIQTGTAAQSTYQYATNPNTATNRSSSYQPHRGANRQQQYQWQYTYAPFGTQYQHAYHDTDASGYQQTNRRPHRHGLSGLLWHLVLLYLAIQFAVSLLATHNLSPYRYYAPAQDRGYHTGYTDKSAEEQLSYPFTFSEDNR